ncbi:MAG: ethylbenzene dehydrogenase-related protein [Planctomycetota bacterium]
MGVHRFPRMAPVVLSVLLLTGCGERPVGESGGAPGAKELIVTRVKGELPHLDPLAGAWVQAREVVVELLPQDVMEPRVSELGPASLRLRGLFDNERVAFRLEWEDGSADALVNVDRSTDAVAIQLPLAGAQGSLPDAMMGEAGKAVFIAQWRYALQERLEGRPHGVAALYPNASVDHYPFEGARDAALRAEMEQRYAPSRAAENPVAAAQVLSAVQDLTAEGFGTLRFLPDQRSQGKGVHAEGKWLVTISRPLDLDAGALTPLRPGASSFIAVATWDGGKGHTGSKKMRSIWVPLRILGGPES